MQLFDVDKGSELIDTEDREQIVWTLKVMRLLAADNFIFCALGEKIEIGGYGRTNRTKYLTLEVVPSIVT